MSDLERIDQILRFISNTHEGGWIVPQIGVSLTGYIATFFIVSDSLYVKETRTSEGSTMLEACEAMYLDYQEWAKNHGILNA